MRKGIGDQFNWIFVMFVGALFFVFFVGFGVKYIGLQETRENAEISRAVDVLLEGFDEDTLYKNITFDGLLFELDFDCDSFRVNNGFGRSLEGKSVFVPNELVSDSLFVWAQQLKFPFDGGNLIYLIDRDTKYALYGGAIVLLEGLPEPLQDKFVGSGDADVNVFFNGLGAGLDGYTVSFEGGEHGRVFFYEEGNLIGESYYYNEAFMYAAIFAQTKEQYECGLNRALDRLDGLREVYSQKAGLLRNTCDYSSIRGLLSYSGEGPGLYQNVVDLEVDNERFLGCEAVF